MPQINKFGNNHYVLLIRFNLRLQNEKNTYSISLCAD